MLNIGRYIEMQIIHEKERKKKKMHMYTSAGKCSTRYC